MKLLKAVKSGLVIVEHRRALIDALGRHLILAGSMVRAGQTRQAKDLLVNMTKTMVVFVERGGHV